MSCLDDLKDFYGFYGFYDFYGFNDLPLTADSCLLTPVSYLLLTQIPVLLEPSHSVAECFFHWAGSKAQFMFCSVDRKEHVLFC